MYTVNTTFSLEPVGLMAIFRFIIFAWITSTCGCVLYSFCSNIFQYDQYATTKSGANFLLTAGLMADDIRNLLFILKAGGPGDVKPLVSRGGGINSKA